MRALVYLDLDDCKHAVKSKGWASYTPNPITGELSRLVEELAGKHSATVLHGLDSNRGTEEALIFFSDIPQDTLEEELEEMRKKIQAKGKEQGTNTTISIGVAANTPETNLRAVKRQDIKKHPVLRLAYDALRKAKRRGNCVVWG